MVTVIQESEEQKLEFELGLIKEVQKRPFLYNKQHKNQIRNKEAWLNIEQSLGFSVEVCKKRWDNLKRYFRKQRNKAQSKAEPSCWIHYEALRGMLEFENQKAFDNSENDQEEEEDDVKVIEESEEQKLEFELGLIEEVKKRPFLYNKQHRNQIRNKEAWLNIEQSLGCSVEVCKKRWDNLKRYFRKQRNRAQNKDEPSCWIHYEALRGMLEFENQKASDTSENDQEEDEDDVKNETKLPLSGKSDEKNDQIYRKCGEILISKSKEFKYICHLCRQEYNDIGGFVIHTLAKHLKSFENIDTFGSSASTSRRNSNECSEIEIDTMYLSQNNVDIKVECQNPVEIVKYKTEGESLIERHDNESFAMHDAKENMSNNEETYSNGVAEQLEENVTKEDQRQKQEVSENVSLKEMSKRRESKKGTFPCEQCNRIFEYRSQLYRHKRLHTGERPYKCEVCSQAFRHHRNLKDHFAVCHSEERPFPCRHEGCDKKFKTIRIRKLHEILHTDDLPFQCQDCGKRFPQNSYLITHRNTWHVDKSKRRHKCQHCDKSFYSKQNLKYHTYTHTGERPYGCPLCSTRFTKPWSVKEHMKIHSGERKYVCNACGAAFNQIAGLIKHKKRHEEVVD